MRRLITLSVVVLLSASVQVVAQRGGGGHGFSGGHGGFAAHGGSASHVGSGHAFGGGVRSGSGFAARSFARGSYSSSFRRPLSSRAFNHSSGVRIRTYGFGNNCYGYACRGGYGYRYPWLWGGAFDPYWWWDSGSNDDRDRQINLANEMNAQSLDEQRMRQQTDQDVYARPAPTPPHEAQRSELSPPTVLVFRDQHQQQVQNYAIVGQTLWNFAPQRTEKIPLSSLDLAATEKVNDERGVGFRVPNAPEGQ